MLTPRALLLLTLLQLPVGIPAQDEFESEVPTPEALPGAEEIEEEEPPVTQDQPPTDKAPADTEPPASKSYTPAPAVDKASTLVPLTEKPFTEVAAPTDKPTTTTKPTTAKPTTRKPTTRKPTTRKPTTRKPTTRKPTTRKPTTRKPTTRKPTTKKPPTRKPTTRKPTTRKSTTRKPPTHKPPPPKPPTQKPPPHKPPVHKPPTDNDRPFKNEPPTDEENPTEGDEVGCGHSFLFDRIIAGDDALAKKWPWQVSIQETNNHMCGGSLVATKWVLTAAHCIKNNLTYNVLLGSTLLNAGKNKNSIRIPVKKVVIHPSYQENRYWSWVGRENDVALLQLAYTVNYTHHISPVCIASPLLEVIAGSHCWVTGWGQTREHPTEDRVLLSPILQEAEITILNNDECDALYHAVSEVPNIVRIISQNMICSDYSRGRDFCYGDDGGPLVCEIDNTWFQTGLVSWGMGCARQETPGVYSRISEYSSWIERVIAELDQAVSTLLASSCLTLLSLLFSLSLMLAL